MGKILTILVFIAELVLGFIKFRDKQAAKEELSQKNQQEIERRAHEAEKIRNDTIDLPDSFLLPPDKRNP